VTGYAQHGKNTVADIVSEFLSPDRVHVVGFADALRRMARAIDPIIMWSSDPRDEPVPVRYSELVDVFGYEAAKQQPEVRRFLQVLGTEGVRDIIGSNAWVDALNKTLHQYEDGSVTIITDVRFPNEADFVLGLGELWGVTRTENGEPYDNGLSTDHPSEQFIGELKKRADRNFVADNKVELIVQVSRAVDEWRH
jgi:hypothetical protein